jgi:hypothetical protein
VVPGPDCGHGSLIENDHSSAALGQVRGKVAIPKGSLIENDHGSAVPGQIRGSGAKLPDLREYATGANLAEINYGILLRLPIKITRGVDVFPPACGEAEDETSASTGISAHTGCEIRASGCRASDRVRVSYQRERPGAQSSAAEGRPMHYHNRRCKRRNATEGDTAMPAPAATTGRTEDLVNTAGSTEEKEVSLLSTPRKTLCLSPLIKKTNNSTN